MKIPILSKYLDRRSSLTKWLKWLELEGANASNAGIYINQDSALSSAAVLAALRVLSTTMAQLPFPVYRRLANGGKERAAKHPLFTILHDDPNNYQTAFEFRQMMMVHSLLHGNFYALIDRDVNSGEVTRLLPFASPTSMECKLFDDVVQYKYTLPNGTAQILDDRTVLHIRGMSTTGLMGLSLLEKGKDTIGVSLALQQFTAKFFRNGANLQGVLEHPGALTEEGKKYLSNAWAKTYAGSENAFKTAVLEEGMKYKSIGVSPDDAQALESRQFQVNEVARIFGVPPHLIGDLTRATFSNIEHQSIEFVVYCIAPWAVNIQQRISKQLLNSDEKQQYFAEFTLAALMRGDYKSRQEGLNIMRQNGIISTNDWRGLENMNPIADEGADAYLVNGNMISIKAAMEATPGQGFGQQYEPAAEPEPDPPKEPDPEPAKKKEKKSCDCGCEEDFGPAPLRQEIRARQEIAESYQEVFRDAGSRIVRREAEKVRAAIKRHLESRDSTSFIDWMTNFYTDEFPDFVTKQMTAPARSLAKQTAKAAEREIENPGEVDINAEVAKYTEAFAKRYTGSSKGQLTQLMRDAAYEDDMAGAMEERIGQWEERRPDKIAMNETNQLSNFISKVVWIAGGITLLRWVASGNACEICQEMDGTVVGIEGSFATEGQTVGSMTVSRDMSQPPLHSSCQCGIMPG